MKLTAREIAAACGGKLLCGDPETPVTSFSTDSRDIRPGCFFVPLKGERTDAHIYIEATLAAGAAGTFTQYEKAPENDSHPWIYVRDCAKALQQTAAWYRSRFSIPVVGITGSVGKTTTKEMVALAFSAGFHTMRTQGNQNSQIGLPLTLFQLEPEHEAAVIEMGMSEFGEMSRLAAIARPDAAIMTNIGLSHIGQLKTQENILREKLHITDGFGPDNVLFVNGDDPYLATLRQGLPFPVIAYGMGETCDYRITNVESRKDGTAFQLAFAGQVLPVFVPAFGLHMAYNAAAAIAAARWAGIAPEKAAKALAGYRPLAMRQQQYEAGGILVIDDTYNASPDSMMGGVDVLCSLEVSGRRAAVLADMLELGELSQEAHRKVGRYCGEKKLDFLFTVGEEARQIAAGAREVLPEMDCREFMDNDSALAALREVLRPGDAVLVKGSRGMHTDEIVHGLLKGDIRIR